MRAKMTDDTANLVRPKANIDGNSQVVKPKFRFHVSAADVHVCWFCGISRIEERRDMVPIAKPSASPLPVRPRQITLC
jgi:hypothetical protein